MFLIDVQVSQRSHTQTNLARCASGCLAHLVSNVNTTAPPGWLTRRNTESKRRLHRPAFAQTLFKLFRVTPGLRCTVRCEEWMEAQEVSHRRHRSPTITWSVDGSHITYKMLSRRYLYWLELYTCRWLLQSKHS